MGVIYDLESELRSLCKSPKENEEKIYIKVKELAGRLIARNQTKLGPDVDRWTLDHEIATYITTRVVNGTIAPIQKWSGYIKCILPRMIKANAIANGSDVIDTLGKGIDYHYVIDMNYSGSISMLNLMDKRLVLSTIQELPQILESWMDKNIRNIDRSSRYYYNLRISITLSLLLGKVTMFRIPYSYKNLLILYTNKFKIYLSKLLLSGYSSNPYDQIMKISQYEETEDYFG